MIGQDNPKAFQAQAAQLGIAERVQFLGGRSDVPRFLLGADLLIHPAYHENTGTALLEADAGRVLPSPFQQAQLNQCLAQMLEDDQARQRWSANGLSYADSADLYSMPQRAADVILAD